MDNLVDDGIFRGYLSDQSNAKLDCDDEWSDCEGQLTDPLDSLFQPGPLLNLLNTPKSPLPKQ